MIINHNITAIFANRNLKIDGANVDNNMEKLASGMRINRAGDDASGLAVSEKMRAQIRGLNRATKNAEDAISFIQTTEGYLMESEDIVQRLRELSVQASNGIYDVEDRMMIQVEVSQLVDEVDRIASHAQFNGLPMLTGRYAPDMIGNNPAASMWFHIGANMDQRERIYISTMNATALGLRNASTKDMISLSTPEKANMTIGVLDMAVSKLSKQRADLGAYQNRLNHTVKALMVGSENLQAAESRIRDTNMAEEMSDFVKNQILSQAATAMLAQANQKPQLVLSLLR